MIDYVLVFNDNYSKASDGEAFVYITDKFARPYAHAVLYVHYTVHRSSVHCIALYITIQ